MSRPNRNQARFSQWLKLGGSLGPCSAIDNINYNPKPHFSNKGICGKAHNLSSWVSHYIICTSLWKINLRICAYSLNVNQWHITHETPLPSYNELTTQPTLLYETNAPKIHKWKYINHITQIFIFVIPTWKS